MIAGDLPDLGVIGHFVDVGGSGDAGAAGAAGLRMLTADGLRQSQKHRDGAAALALALGGARGASFTSRAGPLVDAPSRAALVRPPQAPPRRHLVSAVCRSISLSLLSLLPSLCCLC